MFILGIQAWQSVTIEHSIGRGVHLPCHRHRVAPVHADAQQKVAMVLAPHLVEDATMLYGFDRSVTPLGQWLYAPVATVSLMGASRMSFGWDVGRCLRP